MRTVSAIYSIYISFIKIHIYIYIYTHINSKYIIVSIYNNNYYLIEYIVF